MYFNANLDAASILALLAACGAGTVVGKLVFAKLFTDNNVKAVFIDVADCNAAIQFVVKDAQDRGLNNMPINKIAFYQQQLGAWLSAQGIQGDAHRASLSKLVSDAIALEKEVAAKIPQPPAEPAPTPPIPPAPPSP